MIEGLGLFRLGLKSGRISPRNARADNNFDRSGKVAVAMAAAAAALVVAVVLVSLVIVVLLAAEAASELYVP